MKRNPQFDKRLENKFAEVKHNPFRQYYGVVDVVEGGQVKHYLFEFETRVRSVATKYFDKKAKNMNGVLTTVGSY